MKKKHVSLFLDTLSRAVVKKIYESRLAKEVIGHRYDLDKTALANLCKGKGCVQLISYLKFLRLVREQFGWDVADWHAWLCLLTDDMLDELDNPSGALTTPARTGAEAFDSTDKR